MIALNQPEDGGFALVPETEFERDWIDRQQCKIFKASLRENAVVIKERGPYHNKTGLVFMPITPNTKTEDDNE